MDRPFPRRPEASDDYPWYDSAWLARYRRAERILAAHPARLAEFRQRMAVFRTREDYTTRLLRAPFDSATLAGIRDTVANLDPRALELHEARTFRRYVVHDHPAFAAVAQRGAQIVSEVAGEPVEPSYNFLALYASAGVCPLHLDAPHAKWTLDLNVDESGPWAIHLSRVLAWEEFLEPPSGAEWEQGIKADPGNAFRTFTPRPGEALVFSGSSQWHYRDAMPASSTGAGSTLLFMHYIPRGTAELVQPESWARIFAVPELG